MWYTVESWSDYTIQNGGIFCDICLWGQQRKRNQKTNQGILHAKFYRWIVLLFPLHHPSAFANKQLERINSNLKCPFDQAYQQYTRVLDEFKSHLPTDVISLYFIELSSPLILKSCLLCSMYPCKLYWIWTLNMNMNIKHERIHAQWLLESR